MPYRMTHQCYVQTDFASIGNNKRIQFLQIGCGSNNLMLKQQLKHPDVYPLPNLDMVKWAQLELNMLLNAITLKNDAALEM